MGNQCNWVNQCNIFGGEATNDKDMIFEQQVSLKDANENKKDGQNKQAYRSGLEQESEKIQDIQNKELTFNNNNNKLENYVNNNYNANELEFNQQDDQVRNNDINNNNNRNENNANNQNPVNPINLNPALEDTQKNDKLGDDNTDLGPNNCQDFNPQQNLENQYNNDNYNAARLDNEVVNNVDEVMNQNNNEDHEKSNDSIIMFSDNTNVQFTGKKTKTENFKINHPLKNSGIENFKSGFQKKMKNLIK